MKIRQLMVALFFAFLLAGCASLQSQFNDEFSQCSVRKLKGKNLPTPQVYSGTCIYATWVWGFVTLDEASWSCEYGPLCDVLGLLGAFIDTPLCVITDTLLLPYTIHKQIDMGSIPACQ